MSAGGEGEFQLIFLNTFLFSTVAGQAHRLRAISGPADELCAATANEQGKCESEEAVSMVRWKVGAPGVGAEATEVDAEAT